MESTCLVEMQRSFPIDPRVANGENKDVIKHQNHILHEHAKIAPARPLCSHICVLMVQISKMIKSAPTRNDDNTNVKPSVLIDNVRNPRPYEHAKIAPALTLCSHIAVLMI